MRSAGKTVNGVGAVPNVGVLPLVNGGTVPAGVMIGTASPITPAGAGTEPAQSDEGAAVEVVVLPLGSGGPVAVESQQTVDAFALSPSGGGGEKSGTGRSSLFADSAAAARGSSGAVGASPAGGLAWTRHIVDGGEAHAALLGKIGDPQSIELLRALASNPDPEVRLRAAEQLSAFDDQWDDTSDVLASLSSEGENLWIRIGVAEALGRKVPEERRWAMSILSEVIDTILAGDDFLVDEHGATEREDLLTVAASALGPLQSDEETAAESLFAALGVPRPAVNVFDVLRRILAFEEQTETDLWEASAGVAEALGRMRGFDERRLNMLRDLSTHPVPDVRVHVAESLGMLSGHDRMRLDLLAGLAADENAAVRGAAVEALGKMEGFEKWMPIVERLQGDDSPFVRVAIAGVLGRRPEYAAKAVNDLEAMTAPEVGNLINVNAVKELGEVQDPEGKAMSILKRVLFDPSSSWSLKSVAAEALGKRGGSAAMEALAAYLDGGPRGTKEGKSESFVREAVLSALISGHDASVLRDASQRGSAR